MPALYDAVTAAGKVKDKPSLIVLDTIIAWPAPNAQGTEKAHGSALGADEVAATKKVLGWDPEKTFEVPDEVLAHTRSLSERGAAWGAAWDERVRRLGGRQPRQGHAAAPAQGAHVARGSRGGTADLRGRAPRASPPGPRRAM